MAQVKVLPRAKPLIDMRRAAILAELTTLLLLAFVIVLVTYGQRQPEPLSAAAPPGVFASGRAMEHLKKIADKPHPLGSAEHAAVRDYLVQELTALGLDAEVQRATGINAELTKPVTAGTVENIVAKMPGTENQQAVLLMAHYDSVPTGPGASDDGSAVAAILETARALRTGSPLKNDVIFLLTDGEEAGLLGAQAFIGQHPFAKNVSVALNFEARGSSGPVLMFETSARNSSLIDEFAHSAPYPATNSLLYAIYKLLPNDTDLSVFKQAGLRGFNFAFIEQTTHYHTQLDSIGNIDTRSLQQQGSLLLALTRSLGNSDLSAMKTNHDAIYFDLFNAFLVHYPVSWALPLAIAVLLVFVVVVGFGIKRKRLRLAGIALGFVAMVSSIGGAWLIVSLVWRLVLAVHGQYRTLPWGDTYNSGLYFLSFLALTAAITSLIGALFGKRVGMHDLWVGALSCWLVLLITTALFLPGASYLLMWPLLLSLVVLVPILFAKQQTGSPSLKHQVLLLIGVVAGLVLFVPVIRMLFAGLTISSAGMVMSVTALLFGLFVPQIQLLTARKRWLLPGILLLLSAGFLVAGGSTSGFSESHPKPDNIFYGFDAAMRQAVWASTDQQPDEWTSQFFSSQTQTKSLPEFFPLRLAQFRIAPAPVAPLSAPDVQVLADSRSNGLRFLRLKITSARQAPVISVGIESDMEVKGTMLNEQPIKIAGSASPAEGGNKWGLRYFAVPTEGIELTLEAKSSQPLAIRVVDQSYGLPQLPAESYRPRPASTIPSPLPFSDSTFVSRLFSF